MTPFPLQMCLVPGTKAQKNLTEMCLEDMSYSNERLTEGDCVSLDVLW